MNNPAYTSIIKSFWRALLSISVVLLISACENSNSPSRKTIDISLNITDTSGMPLDGVTITVKKPENAEKIAVSVSDISSGSYQVSDAPILSDLTFQLSKAGYSTQIKPVITLNQDNTQDFSAVMIKQQVAISFSVDEESETSGKDGVNIKVTASAFVDKDGNPVSGDVDLRMTPIDVSTRSGKFAYPGYFQGVSDVGVLEEGSKGILEDGSEIDIGIALGVAEFNFSQNGEALQLAPGQTAEIIIPLYENANSNGEAIAVNDEIPLWYLNEDTGLWQQQGMGQVILSQDSPVGLAIRGTVNHFSYWMGVYWTANQQTWIHGLIPNTATTAQLTLQYVRIDEFDGTFATPGSFRYGAGSEGFVYVDLFGPGGYERRDHIREGDPLVFDIFEGDWCFSIYGTLYKVRPDGFYDYYHISSKIHCQNIQDGDTITLELDSVDNFDLINNVRRTATVNADFGSCGDFPNIKSNSRFVGQDSVHILQGSLPPGLELSNSGVVQGTPTTTGEYSASLGANKYNTGVGGLSDISTTRVRATVPITVSEALSLEASTTPAVLKAGIVQGVEGFFTAEGGLTSNSGYKWRGAVPFGMTLDITTGNYSGAPALAPIVNGDMAPFYLVDVQLEVEDENCATATAGYTQYVIAVPLLSGEPSDVEVGDNFSFTPVNTGLPAESWGIDAPDSLLSWASFDVTTGELSGVPGTGDIGVYENIVIYAYGPEGTSNIFNGIPIPAARITESLTISFEVTLALPELQPTGDFSIAAGQNFSFTANNIGGAIDSWEMDNAPTWLSIDSVTGAVTGVPTTIAQHTDIVIRAIGATGFGETPVFTINVVSQALAPNISGTLTSSASAVDQRFIYIISNSGGFSDQFSITPNSLPAGLQFDTTDGSIVGFPTQAGLFPTEITATNGVGSDLLQVTLLINRGTQNALTFADPGPLQKFTSNGVFTNTLSGGTGTGVVSYLSSDPGVASVDSVSGEVTLQAVGSTDITASKAVDANYMATSSFYQLNVVELPILSGVPARAKVDVSYNFTLVNLGGTATSYTRSGDNLPAGLIFSSSTGGISGIPEEAGTFNLSITAIVTGGSDVLPIVLIVDKGDQATLNFVNPGTIQTLLGDANLTNTVSGGSGSGALSYQSSDSNVASVNGATGEVSILTAGTATITATKAADLNYQQNSRSYILQVNGAGTALVISPPNGNVGAAYGFMPEINGITVIDWQVTAGGGLPNGLSINAGTGLISGVPDTEEIANFTLRAESDGGGVVSIPLSITIEAASVTTTPDLWVTANSNICDIWIPGFDGGCSIDMTVNVSSLNYTFVSGDGPIESWSESGALPAGLSFDTSTGTISGTPTETGSFSFNVTAVNSIGDSNPFIMMINVQ